MRLILIRHGYSKNNKEKRFTGHMDVPLDEIGYMQADAVSKYVSENFKVDAVYSSDLIRAVDTVKPIANASGLDVIKTDAFREINVGKWQNMSFDDIIKNYPEKYKEYQENKDDFCFEGGESFKDMSKRAVLKIEEIAKKHEDETVVIGTHGGAVRAIVAFYKNIPVDEVPYAQNCSVTVAEYENGKMTFSQIGYCDFLEFVTELKF